MSLFNSVRLREAPFVPALNTGTIMDVATGTFIPAVDGSHILNGGIGLTNATIGRPQMFKSTLQVATAIRAWARYPGSDLAVYDTERTLQEDRLLKMADVTIPESNKMQLTTRSEYHAEDFFQWVQGIAQWKIDHRKDYLVEIPHIDPKTGKRQMIMRPTFVGFDSWSNMEPKVVEDTLRGDIKVDEDGNVISKTTITGSETNTFAMKDGLAKMKMIKELNSIAEKAGIYMFFTAHVGDKIEMNPYAPTPKTLTHMKASDKAKGVGSTFMFLMMNLFDCRTVGLMFNGNDKTQSRYPTKDGYTTPTDLNEVMQVVSRCKSNASGTQIPWVVSQSEGPLAGLTHYHYLKENKRWGLPGNDQRHAPVLMPDNTVQRTTINDKLRAEPRLARALEILAQLCFIQSNWTLRDAPVPFDMDPLKLADKLMSSGYAMDDILDSRGWWTYAYDGIQNPQTYLSLYDILAIVDGTYKPKFLSVGSVPASKADDASKKVATKAA